MIKAKKKNIKKLFNLNQKTNLSSVNGLQSARGLKRVFICRCPSTNLSEIHRQNTTVKFSISIVIAVAKKRKKSI
jgi:hypothetical protein